MKTMTINWKKHQKWYISLTDDTAFKFIPPYVQKKKRKWVNCILFLEQDIVGNRKIVLPNDLRWLGGEIPEFSSEAKVVDAVTLYYPRRTEIYASATIGLTKMPKMYRYNSISPVPEIIY